VQGFEQKRMTFIMPKDIVWETSFRNALALAKKTNKLMLASFFDPCCEACARLKTSTLTAGCVQDCVHEHFIAIKFESGADAEQFMRFDVTAKPAIIVFDADGNEIFRKIGYFEPDVFVSKLEMAIKKAAHRAAGHHV
jgi:thioredoxin-related protein